MATLNTLGDKEVSDNCRNSGLRGNKDRGWAVCERGEQEECLC